MVYHEFGNTAISPIRTSEQKRYVIFICIYVRNHETETNY